MSKRKCSYRDDFSEKLPGIKRSKKGECFAFCDLCHSDMNTSSGDISHLKKHVKSSGHLSALKEKNCHHAISKFLLRDTPADIKSAAVEGTLAFHAVKQQHSFNSTNCTTQLVESLFSDSNVVKKLSCGRIKIEAIIKGVLTPVSVNAILHSLGDKPYANSTDASNHRQIKMFSIVIL
jgi:hypothetical protein